MSEQTERVSRQSRLQGPFTLGFLHTLLSRVARRYYRTAYWGDHLFSVGILGSPHVLVDTLVLRPDITERN